MKKKLLNQGIYLFVVFLSIGCGGGSSSGSSSSGESGNSDASSNSGSVESLTWTPKATNVTCDLSKIDGGTYSALGDVTVSCQKENRNSVRYELKNVKTLTATEIVKHKYFTLANSTDKLHTVYDYEKGTVLYHGTLKGSSYDCTETYPSIIPDTVSNSSLGKILNWRGNNNDRVSTTCPESFYDAKVDSNYNQASQIKGLSFFGINYSITDDNNGQHFITVKVE